MNWALAQSTGKPHLKLVLLVLADVANENDESWYSQDRLAELAEVPVRSLRRYLEALDGLGLLQRSDRVGAGGKRATDLYRLPVSSGQNGRWSSGQDLAGGPAAKPAETSGQALAGEPTEETTEPKEGEPTQIAPAAQAAVWMHQLWQEVLGEGGGRPPALTALRKQKYRAMFEEQLAGAPDPHMAWKLVLRTVALSDYHMSQLAYRLPESFLRNAERRDRWVLQTAQNIEKANIRRREADDFAAMYRARASGGS
jgi:hypothetical protein